ncbi:hypothetical protein BN946_scf184962.g3 [Trametes cinnabarina]|uniref:Uncharacterized protein n=1 Tax=Pycnoporus cinnabarinus TaxID=5643 RepID=A0A060SCG9_PYCCI|nr:hypothetical protein BN946_scf184962.g3 [Trametes cinnabarina]
MHFKFPKLHSLNHYLLSIMLFGTTDNYDTQYTEHLHIDFAKDTYRGTNCKDEFPQMTLWLEHCEKVLRHEAYVRWCLRRQPQYADDQSSSSEPEMSRSPSSPDLLQLRPHLHASLNDIVSHVKITCFPSVKAVSFDAAVTRYGALYLRDTLPRFVIQYQDPRTSDAEVEQRSLGVYLRFRTMPIFHKICFFLEDAQNLGIMEDVWDTAHA